MVKGISPAVQDEDLSGGGFFWFEDDEGKFSGKSSFPMVYLQHEQRDKIEGDNS